MKQIGVFSETVIKALNLKILPGTPIYIGESNTNHIKDRHPIEYETYLPRIEEIIAEPDYVGKNEKNQSVDFVKLFKVGTEYVQISVRISSKGTWFAKTMFMLMTYKAERYIEQGTLVKIS